MVNPEIEKEIKESGEVILALRNLFNDEKFALNKSINNIEKLKIFIESNDENKKKYSMILDVLNNIDSIKVPLEKGEDEELALQTQLKKQIAVFAGNEKKALKSNIELFEEKSSIYKKELETQKAEIEKELETQKTEIEKKYNEQIKTIEEKITAMGGKDTSNKLKLEIANLESKKQEEIEAIKKSKSKELNEIATKLSDLNTKKNLFSSIKTKVFNPPKPQRPKPAPKPQPQQKSMLGNVPPPRQTPQQQTTSPHRLKEGEVIDTKKIREILENFQKGEWLKAFKKDFAVSNKGRATINSIEERVVSITNFIINEFEDKIIDLTLISDPYEKTKEIYIMALKQKEIFKVLRDLTTKITQVKIDSSSETFEADSFKLKKIYIKLQGSISTLNLDSKGIKGIYKTMSIIAKMDNDKFAYGKDNVIIEGEVIYALSNIIESKTTLLIEEINNNFNNTKNYIFNIQQKLVLEQKLKDLITKEELGVYRDIFGKILFEKGMGALVNFVDSLKESDMHGSILLAMNNVFEVVEKYQKAQAELKSEINNPALQGMDDTNTDYARETSGIEDNNPESSMMGADF